MTAWAKKWIEKKSDKPQKKFVATPARTEESKRPEKRKYHEVDQDTYQEPNSKVLKKMLQKACKLLREIDVHYIFENEVRNWSLCWFDKFSKLTDFREGDG